MEDFRQDGRNAGRGRGRLNAGHDPALTDADDYDYRRGFEEGQRSLRYNKEWDREEFGED